MCVCGAVLSIATVSRFHESPFRGSGWEILTLKFTGSGEETFSSNSVVKISTLFGVYGDVKRMPMRVPSVEKILDQYYGDIDTMSRRGSR